MQLKSEVVSHGSKDVIFEMEVLNDLLIRDNMIVQCPQGEDAVCMCVWVGGGGGEQARIIGGRGEGQKGACEQVICAHV